MGRSRAKPVAGTKKRKWNKSCELERYIPHMQSEAVTATYTGSKTSGLAAGKRRLNKSTAEAAEERGKNNKKYRQEAKKGKTEETMESTKKTVVITGGTSGLGKALKELYRRDGYNVCDLSRSCSDEANDEYTCDVTDEAQVSEVVDKIAAKYGRIDAVVNNAGAGVFGTAELTPMCEIKRIMNVSYFGALYVTRACLKHMGEGGRIIFMSSISALTVTPFHSAYCSAKAAELMLGEALRLELKKAGITVICICPGEIATGFSANKKIFAQTNERYLDRVAKAEKLALSRSASGKRMPAEKAALKIYRKCIRGRKALYIIGGKYKFFRIVQRLTSDTAFLNLTGIFAS